MSYVRGPVPGYPVAIPSLGAFSAVDRRPAAASAAWPSDNLAIYVPVCLPTAATVLKLGVANGSTASGNFDLGIYDAKGTRLVSTGSTAQSGTNTEQIVDVTDTRLPAGLYYFAACMDGTTGTARRLGPSVPGALANGVLSEALGSVTLPATATFAADQTLAYVPLVYAFLEATAT